MYVRTAGSGPAVLFIHGIPTSGAIWEPLVAALSPLFRCVVVDLPGLGRSAETSSDFRELPALAATLDDVRQSHGIDKWHIVGHDAGCAIAVHYAFRYRHRVAHLGLLSPSMFPELKPFYLFEFLRRPIVGECAAPLVNLLFWQVAMRLAVTGNRRLVDDFRAPFGGVTGSWRLMNLLRWGSPAAVLAAIPEMLPAIDAPTAIFHGLHDPAIPVEFARRAHQLLPVSQLTLLETGHFLPLNEPTVIARQLLEFFAGGCVPVARTSAASAAMQP